MELVDRIPREYNLTRIILPFTVDEELPGNYAAGHYGKYSYTLDEDAIIVAAIAGCNIDYTNTAVQECHVIGVLSHRPIEKLVEESRYAWCKVGASHRQPAQVVDLRGAIGSYILMRREETLHVYASAWAKNTSSVPVYWKTFVGAIVRVKG